VTGGSAYVVGLGETPFAPRRDDVNTTELAWEAIREALGDAGVELAQITGVISASQDFWEGRTISSMAVNEVAGATFKAESKVAADGALAVGYAAARIATGGDTLMLVLAHCKESQADPHQVENAAFDPLGQRLLDPDETVIAGFQAQLLGFDLADRARVVAAARGRSAWLGETDAATVAASPETASPLRELERAPLMDGAVALVLCDQETAGRLGRPAVRVASVATETGSYWLDRDLTAAPGLKSAFGRALSAAGWDDAPDRVELAAPFAHQALLFARELGAGGAEAFENGLCPTGGWLAGRPGVVAGLSNVVAGVRALQGTSDRAIAHGTTGLLAQSHHVVCLEGAG
jgi:acetyl-CoA C-acetyltransferase